MWMGTTERDASKKKANPYNLNPFQFKHCHAGFGPGWWRSPTPTHWFGHSINEQKYYQLAKPQQTYCKAGALLGVFGGVDDLEVPKAWALGSRGPPPEFFFWILIRNSVKANYGSEIRMRMNISDWSSLLFLHVPYYQRPLMHLSRRLLHFPFHCPYDALDASNKY